MLSVVLAVYNEEENLERCLASIQGLADEIVIVDGGSTDRSLEIAKKFHAHIIRTTNPPMFHINKQKALDAAKHEWILQLDADEVVGPQLRKDIEHVVAGTYAGVKDQAKLTLFDRHEHALQSMGRMVGKNSGEVVAYFIPRLNFFLGGWLRHAGVYPDGVIRLVKRGKAHFPCKDVHEQIEVDGRTAWLEHDLLHYADPTFHRYMMRANRYTSLTAKAMRESNVSRSWIGMLHYMFLKPIAVFLSLYIRHKGILDGFPGLIWSLFSGLHYPIAYMKYWENTHE